MVSSFAEGRVIINLVFLHVGVLYSDTSLRKPYLYNSSMLLVCAHPHNVLHIVLVSLDRHCMFECPWECMYRERGLLPFTTPTHIILTFPQSMQHCLACPACAHSPEDWGGRMGPLQDKELSLQWTPPSMLLHRTTTRKVVFMILTIILCNYNSRT